MKYILIIIKWLYWKLPVWYKREFIKYVVEFIRRWKDDEIKLYRLKAHLEKEFKEQEMRKLEKGIIYTKHAKLRIKERFGILTKAMILDDIYNNYSHIEVCKDRSFRIVTVKNKYIFWVDRNLITTYPRDKVL